MNGSVRCIEDNGTLQLPLKVSDELLDILAEIIARDIAKIKCGAKTEE